MSAAKTNADTAGRHPGRKAAVRTALLLALLAFAVYAVFIAMTVLK